jgi:hypothetical protein
MPAIEKLEEIANSYESLKAICKSAKERIKREPSYSSEIIHQAKRKKKIEDKRDVAIVVQVRSSKTKKIYAI